MDSAKFIRSYVILSEAKDLYARSLSLRVEILRRVSAAQDDVAGTPALHAHYHPAPSMTKFAAIAFDLYGTLLKRSGHSIHKEIPRFLGVSRRAWLDLVRAGLLTRSFKDLPDFVAYVCNALVPGHDPSIEPECAALVQRELDSVEIEDGVLSLLSFLKRRGFRLGLISNLSSSYKDPLERLELTPFFDAMLFSCDEGIAKPDPEIYLRLCRRLDLNPSEVLFVGDSLPTDVIGPRNVGMHAMQISSSPESQPAIPHVSGLGWTDFDGGATGPILRPQQILPVNGTPCAAQKIEPVPDALLGRYNLVARVSCFEKRDLYCKRFLLPESVHVEELAYRVQHLIGLSACSASVVDGPEPFLAVSAAPGSKYQGEMDPSISFELGRHYVFAFLFSNADMRPRNAFIEWSGSRPTLTFIDLEHCFFNLAIDTTALTDADHPETIDALGEEGVRQRLNRMVLSDRAMRRSLNTFFDPDTAPPEVVEGFRTGFVGLFNDLKSETDRICGALEKRVSTPPYLIIGTHAYRRAMARVDVDDIRSRLGRDPNEVLKPVLARRGSRMKDEG